MPSRPSDLIRGPIVGGSTAAGDWFYVEHAGGLYRISRAELLNALGAQGAVVRDSNSVFGTNPVNEGKGHLIFVPGSVINSGFMAVFKGAGPTRLGYIGYNNADFELTADNPARMLLNGGAGIVLNGKVGIGPNAPAYHLDLFGSTSADITARIANADGGNVSSARQILEFSSLPNGFAIFEIQKNAGNPYMQLATGSAIGQVYIGTQTAIQFNINGMAGRGAYLTATEFAPTSNNTTRLGNASKLWTEVFAATGPINTSQRSKKANIVYLSRDALSNLRAAALLRVGARLCDLTTSFQWKASIQEKGQAAYDALPLEDRANTSPEIEGVKLARYHSGWIHDDAVAAFEAEGLDAYREGAICIDPKIITKTRMVETTVQATESVPDPEFDVVIEEGVARRVPRTGTIDKPLFREVPLFEADGVTPIMVPVPSATSLVDGQGNPVPQMRQATYSEPVMVAGPPREETYDEEVEGEFVESLRVDYLQTLCLAALKAGTTIPPEE